MLTYISLASPDTILATAFSERARDFVARTFLQLKESPSMVVIEEDLQFARLAAKLEPLYTSIIAKYKAKRPMTEVKQERAFIDAISIIPMECVRMMQFIGGTVPTTFSKAVICQSFKRKEGESLVTVLKYEGRILKLSKGNTIVCRELFGQGVVSEGEFAHNFTAVWKLLKSVSFTNPVYTSAVHNAMNNLLVLAGRTYF